MRREQFGFQTTAGILTASLVTFLFYLLVACFLLIPGAVWSPDEGAKLLQLQSLRMENGVFAQDIYYSGQALDPDLRYADISTEINLLHAQDGKLLFRRLPVFALLTLPFFSLFHWVGLYILPAFGGAVACLAAIAWIPRPKRNGLIWLLIAFGSPICIYAVIFWEHTLASALALSATCLMIRMEPLQKRTGARTALGWTGASLLLVLSVYLRQEIILFAGAFFAAVFILIPSRRLGILWAGLVLGSSLLAYTPLHLLYFKQTVPDNAAYLFRSVNPPAQEFWRPVIDLLVGPPAADGVQSGWIGIILGSAAAGSIWISLFNPNGLPNKLVVRWIRLACLSIVAVSAAILLFNPTYYRSTHGLILSVPWAVLALSRVRDVWQSGDQTMRVAVLTSVFGLAAYAITLLLFRPGPPEGGLEWGARFAITFYPLLALIAGWEFSSQNLPRPEWLAALVLIYLGIGFQFRGLSVIHFDKQVNAGLNQAIQSDPNLQLVSDIWWMRMNAAPIYRDKELFLGKNPQDLAAWVNLAEKAHIQRFSFLTMDPNLPAQVEQYLPQDTIYIEGQMKFANFFFYHMAMGVP